jgi:hypothetical protein
LFHAVAALIRFSPPRAITLLILQLIDVGVYELPTILPQLVTPALAGWALPHVRSPVMYVSQYLRRAIYDALAAAGDNAVAADLTPSKLPSCAALLSERAALLLILNKTLFARRLSPASLTVAPLPSL